LVVALFAATAFAIGVGTVDVPVGQVIDVLNARLFGDPTGIDALTDQIVWEFRTPRSGRVWRVVRVLLVRDLLDMTFSIRPRVRWVVVPRAGVFCVVLGVSG
jgi:hypothetical protein